MHVAVWRSSFSYSKLNLRLLQWSRPLFTSMGAQQVIGGEPETTEEGGVGCEEALPLPIPPPHPSNGR